MADYADKRAAAVSRLEALQEKTKLIQQKIAATKQLIATCDAELAKAKKAKK